jgi:hypothetical protein
LVGASGFRGAFFVLGKEEGVNTEDTEEELGGHRERKRGKSRRGRVAAEDAEGRGGNGEIEGKTRWLRSFTRKGRGFRTKEEEKSGVPQEHRTFQGKREWVGRFFIF